MEQKLCANCGRPNWSSNRCEECWCRHPDFSCDSYDDYLQNRKIYTVFKGNDFYGSGSIDHIQSLIRDWLNDHMRSKNEVTFKVIRQETK